MRPAATAAEGAAAASVGFNEAGPCSRRETNIMRWKCFIPGKEGTNWDGGFFPLTMEFTEDYPAKPPKVTFLVASPPF